jgi:hypothetical protein
MEQGSAKKLAELGFMADTQDTRKCKAAGYHPAQTYIYVDDER